MHFSEFARYLRKLEGTSSRIALVETLAEMFGKVVADEVRPVTYLLQGRLTPVFKPSKLAWATPQVVLRVPICYTDTAVPSAIKTDSPSIHLYRHS